MFTNSIDYTVCSTDPQHYNRINCNLTAPITKYSAMLVSSLTTNCCIVVLNTEDYIEINDVKYSFGCDYSNLNVGTFAGLLKNLLEENGPKVNSEQSSQAPNGGSEISLLTAETDYCDRLIITFNKPFKINEMSYNFKLITGFFNMDLPLESTYNESTQKYFIRAESVGFTLSTPILYLTSNIAAQSYRNLNKDDCVGSKIVMRLNNSFSHEQPIYATNADFETTLLSNDLASLEFKLVDANMQEVHLLSPLYLCIHVRGIPDTDIFGSFAEANQQ